MTTWSQGEIGLTPEGEPMCKGTLKLQNDKGELLGSIMWFEDEGPFYTHGVDLREPDVIRRIGPCTTIDGAKAAVEAVVEGKRDVSGGAGYPR